MPTLTWTYAVIFYGPGTPPHWVPCDLSGLGDCPHTLISDEQDAVPNKRSNKPRGSWHSGAPLQEQVKPSQQLQNTELRGGLGPSWYKRHRIRQHLALPELGITRWLSHPRGSCHLLRRMCCEMWKKLQHCKQNSAASWTEALARSIHKRVLCGMCGLRR